MSSPRQSAAPSGSIHHNNLALGLDLNGAQSVLAPIFQDKGNGGSQAGPRLGLGSSLAVGTGNFRTVGQHPVAVALENSGELIPHHLILLPTGVGPGNRAHPATALGRLGSRDLEVSRHSQ